MATRREGLPYIWVTWLAKLLGGQQCQWRAWFQAHFKYDKHEEMAADLVKWNMEHMKLMSARKRQLEADGWTVFTENQNDFKLRGQVAVVAGKPDIIAVKPGHVLVVDGKTGKPKDADIWQVFLYLYAIQKSRPDLVGELVGEVQYKRDADGVAVSPADLTPDRMQEIVSLIKVVGGSNPPKRVPSRHECKTCNIGPRDCPDRVTAAKEEQSAVAVGDF